MDPGEKLLDREERVWDGEEERPAEETTGERRVLEVVLSTHARMKPAGMVVKLDSYFSAQPG